jgi:hypothetical protein
MYKRAGYNIMHISKDKIRKLDGTFKGQLLMRWKNPSFSNDSLIEYAAYLAQYNYVSIPENAKIKRFNIYQQLKLKPKL